MPDPQKGVAFLFTVALVNSTNRPQFISSPTINSGDFQISKDNGAYTNLSNLPTNTPSGSFSVEISLTASEMTADTICIQGISSANQWDDIFILIEITVTTIDTGVELASNSIQDSTYNRIRGTVQADAGNSMNQFKSNLSSTVDNYYNDSIIKFISGSLQGQVKFITGYVGATKILQFIVGFTGIPSPGDNFDLINF